MNEIKPDRVLFIPGSAGWTKDQIAQHVNEWIGSPGAQLKAGDITDTEAQCFADIVQGHLEDCSAGCYDHEDDMEQAEKELLQSWADSLVSRRVQS